MNYQTLIKRIYQKAVSCDRDPSTIQLIAVSKQRSLSEMMEVYEKGCLDFGENRVDEALEKLDKAPSEIRWHFIGNLQKKKVPKVVGRFSLIHSVDSVELAEKISKTSDAQGIVTPVLLQANVSGEKAKHGLSAEEWKQRFKEVQSFPGIQLKGWMTMAPLTDDRDRIRETFASLKELRDSLDPALSELSMGMSGDWEIAIEEGATLLRIGTAIFSDVENQ